MFLCETCVPIVIGWLQLGGHKVGLIFSTLSEGLHALHKGGLPCFARVRSGEEKGIEIVIQLNAQK